MMNRLIKQVIRFGIVGVMATVIDFAMLHLLVDYLFVHYLIATPIAFVISTLFNYWASMKYIFVSRFSPKEKHKEFVIFVSLSVIGLLLTELLMFIAVDILGLQIMVGKVFVTAIVMIFNFASRKIYLDS